MEATIQARTARYDKTEFVMTSRIRKRQTQFLRVKNEAYASRGFEKAKDFHG
jgi:hypothetical protein